MGPRRSRAMLGSESETVQFSCTTNKPFPQGKSRDSDLSGKRTKNWRCPSAREAAWELVLMTFFFFFWLTNRITNKQISTTRLRDKDVKSGCGNSWIFGSSVWTLGKGRSSAGMPAGMQCHRVHLPKLLLPAGKLMLVAWRSAAFPRETQALPGSQLSATLFRNAS